MCFTLTMLIQEVVEMPSPLWVRGTPSSPACRTAVKSFFVALYIILLLNCVIVPTCNGCEGTVRFPPMPLFSGLVDVMQIFFPPFFYISSLFGER